MLKVFLIVVELVCYRNQTSIYTENYYYFFKKTDCFPFCFLFSSHELQVFPPQLKIILLPLTTYNLSSPLPSHSLNNTVHDFNSYKPYISCTRTSLSPFNISIKLFSKDVIMRNSLSLHHYFWPRISHIYGFILKLIKNYIYLIKNSLFQKN